jgi:hypothetical protein
MVRDATSQVSCVQYLSKRHAPYIGQYSSVKENCRRGTARVKLSLEEKILDAVPLHIPCAINRI